MGSNKNASEETAAELCRQADAELDFEKLLEVASKLQRLLEARRREKNQPLDDSDAAKSLGRKVQVRIQAVIFDMDGLMLDTEPLYRAACQRAAADFGYTLSDAIHGQMIGRNPADAERAVMEAFGPDFPVDDFRERCQKLEAVFEGSGVPKKIGLDELLALLESRRIPKAVATSTRRKIALAQLTSTGLLDQFEAIATGDEVSAGKPAPDLFLLAAQRLGIDRASCLVLEDAETGVLAAHRAGMQVYMVPDLHPPSPATAELADGIFNSLAMVAGHLKLILERTTTLRLATPQDYDFSWRLYAVTMREITAALVGWNESRQSESFSDGWRCEEVRIIVADGVDVGWLQTGVVSDTVFIKQFYIDPSCQGMGLGTQVLGTVIKEASKECMPVALAVMKNNPAHRLYSRMGFRVTNVDRYKFYMQRDP